MMNNVIETRGVTYKIEHLHFRKRNPFCLFLHGFLGTSADFYHIIPHLTDYINPVLLDHLGHGESGKPDRVERYETPELVSDIVEIIKSFTDKPLFLAGYSMGGRLALQTAIRHPELLRGLILESANPGIADADKKSDRKNEDQMRAAEIESNLAQFVRKWNNMPLFQSGHMTDEIKDPGRLRQLRIFQEMQEPGGVAAMLKGFGAGLMPAVSQYKLQQISHPVLLIAGGRDQKFVDIQRRMLDKFPNAHLEIIAESAHRVHIDHPIAYIHALRAFFADQK